MKLLGNYKTKLESFHYQELLDLLHQAIQVGEFSGNRDFDTDSVLKLVAQSQDFDSLPEASAGQRVTDDSLNTPLRLLRARFLALLSEAADFDARAGALLQVLEKDTALLDQLLAAADLERWISLQPPVYGATAFAWDFGMGHGKVASDIALTDPVNLVTYDFRPPVESHFDSSNGQTYTGLAPARQARTTAIKNFTWHYSTKGQKEEISGSDWSRLTLLEDRPLIDFVSNPQVDVLLPLNASVQGIFNVQGVTPGGSLPLYVRTFFHPRRSTTTLTPVNAVSGLGTQFPISAGQRIYMSASVLNTGADGTYQLALSCQKADGTELKKLLLPSISATQDVTGLITIPQDAGISQGQLVVVLNGHTVGVWTQSNILVHLPQQLSPYQIDADSVSVYTEHTDSDMALNVFFANQDFIIDDLGNLTFLAMTNGTPVKVRFTEMFPAYQCSVNETNWSSTIMLDPARPYPDEEEIFPLVVVVNGMFPIVDEMGISTGLFLTMSGRPVADYMLRVTTPALPNYGATATLELELARPSFLNGLQLSPFTTWPARLTVLETQGFSSDTRQTIWSGSAVVDHPVTLRFPRQFVRRIFLTFYQENYSLKEHIVDPQDALRRDILTNLQSVLPLSARRLLQSVPKRYRGAQYEFGIENLQGLDLSPALPTVFVSGPYHVSGCPEIIRLDASVIGSVQFYLCFRAYDGSGIEQDVQLQGVELINSTSVIFPFANTLDRTLVDSTEVYLKIVLRTSLSKVQRLLLQITNV